MCAVTIVYSYNRINNVCNQTSTYCTNTSFCITRYGCCRALVQMKQNFRQVMFPAASAAATLDAPAPDVPGGTGGLSRGELLPGPPRPEVALRRQSAADLDPRGG